MACWRELKSNEIVHGVEDECRNCHKKGVELWLLIFFSNLKKKKLKQTFSSLMTWIAEAFELDSENCLSKVIKQCWHLKNQK